MTQEWLSLTGTGQQCDRSRSSTSVSASRAEGLESAKCATFDALGDVFAERDARLARKKARGGSKDGSWYTPNGTLG